MSSLTESPFREEAALKRLKRRRKADVRFRWYGIAAIAFALAALVFLLSTILTKAVGSFTIYRATLDVTVAEARIAPPGRATPTDISRNIEGFYALIMTELERQFPEIPASPEKRRVAAKLFTRLTVLPLAQEVASKPDLIGQRVRFSLPLSDDLDLYLKGDVSPEARITVPAADSVSTSGAGGLLMTGRGAIAAVTNARAALDAAYGANPARSIILSNGASVARIVSLESGSAKLELLTGELKGLEGKATEARLIVLPEAERTVSDQEIAWLIALDEKGLINRAVHTSLLTQADSTYPELAGVLAALVGSIFTVLLTALLVIPIGVLASVYLEEFAPRNRLTDFIEVNINNLAAVPSIVFGLLGAAVFLGLFGLPRSAALVGGLVLALMTLPVVIIASRAALKAVPPSIRAGALAVGASKMQSVFHHVLPLAAPGILTGSILGLARALGETAPLLLIGMVAFVGDVPKTPLDESTVLPVTIYQWANRAERAWEPMTAAIIIILLVLLIVMNALAVYLRRRFERRW